MSVTLYGGINIANQGPTTSLRHDRGLLSRCRRPVRDGAGCGKSRKLAERVRFVHLRGFAATADLIVSVSQSSRVGVRSLACQP